MSYLALLVLDRFFKQSDAESASAALEKGPEGACVCLMRSQLLRVCAFYVKTKYQRRVPSSAKEPQLPQLPALEEQHRRRRRYLRSPMKQRFRLSMLMQTSENLNVEVLNEPGQCICPPNRENFARSKKACVENCGIGRQWNEETEFCKSHDFGMHYDKKADACVCDTNQRP